MGPKRVLIDTMIFDRIIATRGLTKRIRRLVKDERLTILTTHVQEDQFLASRPSLWKRTRVARIPRVRVPTSDFVFDVSRWDQARLGTGQQLEQIRGTKRHTEDGLIGATALAESAVLVTDDRRLRRRATDAGAEVWDFIQFAECVTSP